MLTDYQHTIVINLHQDFVASKHSNSFQGQPDSSIIYWPNHSEKTRLPKQVKEEPFLFTDYFSKHLFA
jgi:hypothetical protein